MSDVTLTKDQLEITLRIAAEFGEANREIERLEEMAVHQANAKMDLAREVERLEAALNKVIAHGVWNECIHCNAKVKIAEAALDKEQKGRECEHLYSHNEPPYMQPEWVCIHCGEPKPAKETLDKEQT